MVRTQRSESAKGGTMEGSSEYILVAGPAAAFKALREAVDGRGLTVVEDDPRHSRLAFQVDNPRASGRIKALCSVLDAGQGLSKLVVVCFDESDDGRLVDPELALSGLFMQVEHELHTRHGRRGTVALPPHGVP
jgi:hypothetical protein